ncbi:hypothetical protein ACQ4M4_05205 [Leptolyngbya sp. AN02str]|uniref:hypothetical protein n=1 Tax=Leptolyngbya sp. AN02str TaxID=3423363 RepID=UPI003D31C952
MFKSVVRGCQLCIWNYLGLVVFAYLFWIIEIFALTLTISVLIGQPILEGLGVALIFHLIAFVLLLLGAAWFALLLGVWQVFLNLLWSRPPQWLRVQWKLFFSDICISVVAVLPIVFAFFSQANLTTWQYTETDAQAGEMLAQLFIDESLPFIEKSWWIWLLTALILCFYREQKQTN